MYKILIVDDEPIIIQGLCRQVDWQLYSLELAGTAKNGQEALAIMENTNIDILFTDVCMEKIDGLKLIDIAKKKYPTLRCVILSAYSEFKYVKTALLLGVDNYLLKPIDETELNKTIEQIIVNLDRNQISQSKELPSLSSFRTNILDRWVNAAISDYEFFERAETLGINITAEQYVVCVFDIINISNEREKLIYIEKLAEICKQKLDELFGGEIFIDRFSKVIIILNSDNSTDILRKSKNIINSICKDFLENDLKVFCAVSDICYEIDKISACYLNAIDYLNYILIDKSVSCIFIGEVLFKYKQTYLNQLLEEFFNYFIQENFIKVNETSKKVFLEFNNNTVEICKKNIIPFLIIILKHINSTGSIQKDLPRKVIEDFEKFTNIYDFKKLESWYYEILKLSQTVIKNRKQTFHLLVFRTLEIIKNNYQNDLSLKTLAIDLKVSPAYLGQIFKQETGKYFNDYLTNTRLQASKMLLMETNLQIREIVFLVGMPNQSYFNRVFKKTYGMSPLEFRFRK